MADAFESNLQPTSEGVAVVPQEAAAASSFFPQYPDLDSLTRDDALYLLGRIADRVSRAFLIMGGVLSLIHSKEWHKPDYPNFQRFCEDHAGIPYRKAMHLIKVYTTLHGLGLKESDVTLLGYTKLIVLAPHLTEENKQFLLGAAETQTVAELEAMLAKAAADAAQVVSGVSGAKSLEPSNAIIKGAKGSEKVSNLLASYLIVTPPDLVVAALSKLYPDKVFSILTN